MSIVGSNNKVPIYAPAPAPKMFIWVKWVIGIFGTKMSITSVIVPRPRHAPSKNIVKKKINNMITRRI